jgi:hypothetical protein
MQNNKLMTKEVIICVYSNFKFWFLVSNVQGTFHGYFPSPLLTVNKSSCLINTDQDSKKKYDSGLIANAVNDDLV